MTTRPAPTGVRRTLLLLGVMLAVFLAAPGTAQAAFSDASPAVGATVGTLKVAPPTKVSTAGTRCVTTYNPWNNTYSTRLDVKLSWTSSATTRGLDGYLVTAHFTNGQSTPVAWVDAPGTSVNGSADGYYANQNITVTVTTHTDYGWTAESAKSGVIKC